MRDARFARSYYDELAAFTKWWWISSLFTGLFYLRTYDEYESFVGREHDYLLRVSIWGAVLIAMFAALSVLAFARQGRIGRNVPKLAGAAAPPVFLYQFSSYALMVVGVACVALVLATGTLGRRALRRALADAPSLAGWSAPRVTDRAAKPLRGPLRRACGLLRMNALNGHMRTGTIDGRAAAVFSGTCTITAIAHPVDWRARVALTFTTILSQGRGKKPEKYQETTRLFITVIATNLRSPGRLSSFDLRSRDRADADVVFDNVADRREQFESIELDRYHEVRVPNSQDQVDTWHAFAPDVLEELAGRRRMNIRKDGTLLICMRIGGGGRRATIDDMVELTTWFAKRANSARD